MDYQTEKFEKSPSQGEMFKRQPKSEPKTIQDQNKSKYLSNKVSQIMKSMKSKTKDKKELGAFLSSIKCNGLRKGTWHSVCVHKDCKQSVIICDEGDCDCRESHQMCYKEIAETFVSKAIKKSKVRVNNQWLDSLWVKISKLSSEIEKIYARLRLCFLDRNEGNFVFCLQSGNAAELQTLTGRQMHIVQKELEMPISKQGVKAKVKKVWSNMSLQKVDDMVQNSLSIVESLQEKRQWFEKNNLEQIKIKKQKEEEAEAERTKRAEIEELKNRLIESREKFITAERARIKAAMGSSNVLSSVEEWGLLLEMFASDKRPKGFKLLFRASDHGFDVKYKEKYCGVAHTVLLVKTEYGKVIGGYTPLKWKILKEKHKWQTKYDTSGKSFVFSINNNNQSRTHSLAKTIPLGHHNEIGPWFCNRIQICNNSNTEKESRSFNFDQLPLANPEDKGNDKKQETKYIGTSYCSFCTQQWEVHRVIFEEQSSGQLPHNELTTKTQ